MKYPTLTSTAAARFAPTTHAALVAVVKAGQWCTKPQAKAAARKACTGACTSVQVVYLSPTGVAQFVEVGPRGGWRVLHTYGVFSFSAA
jgi:hypothetical protein